MGNRDVLIWHSIHPKGNIKSQVFEDFLAKFRTSINKEVSSTWILLVDRSCNIKEINVYIVLEGPKELVIEKSLKFKFKGSNRKVGYEALIIDKAHALEVSALIMWAKINSQLEGRKISSDSQKKESKRVKYLKKVYKLFGHFQNIEI